MKQSSTTSEYIEPIGFKGTLGEWYAGDKIRSDNHSCPIPFIEVCGGDILWLAYIAAGSLRTKDEAAANAALIAQAKELAKALQSARDVLIMASLIDKSDTCNAEVKRIELALQKAGLTNK